MAIQKLTLQITVMCATETLEEAVNAYSGLTLSQIGHNIEFGDDIGSGPKIVESETIDDADQVREELLAIGNDGEFFDVELAQRCQDSDEDSAHDYKDADDVDTGTDAIAIICKNCGTVSARDPIEEVE